MTTETNVHPMVMKAAIGLRDHIAPQIDKNPAEFWDKESQSLIAAAQAALTECGALECLEALEKARDALDAGSRRIAQLSIPRDSAAATIANVYGSAP